MRPVFIIEVYDNSPLPIENQENIEFRINRKAPLTEFSTEVDSFYFETFKDNVPLKARLVILADSLDFGDNSLFVVAKDGTGNTDTLDLDVFVSQNGFIENVMNYPNPASTSTKFKFDYLGPRDEGETIIDIYNLNGKKEATLKQNTAVGLNEVKWNLLNDNGVSIPQGIYIYFLQIKDKIYVEPVWGKIIINK
jgi:hypothetical protein